MDSKLQYVGWQLGITYQANDDRGVNPAYLHDLLSEMSDHGMNFISFMMISYALNDPNHDGYTWPVANPRLDCYKDRHCTNANEETEFLTEIIGEAVSLGFHVNLFMNGFWWNHDRVTVGYPNIRAMGDTGNSSYHHCADNDDTWRLACDDMSDLLNYYSHLPISSYGFEMIGREGCKCPDTMRLFSDALALGGLERTPDAGREEDLFRLWSGMRDKQVLEEFVIAIKQAAPSTEVWHHGYMELGDLGGYRFSADSYRKAGIQTAIPCVHTLTSEEGLKAVLDSADGFPVVLHVDTRNTPTHNYDNVPLKTPEYIHNMGKWIIDHNTECLKGVAFFNEPPTSKENKNAVYQTVKNWQEGGLF